MIEEVYDYLRKFGFSKENLKEFEKINKKMYFVSINKIKKNISFLVSKGLSHEEIIQVVGINPFLLTTSDKRQSALDDIYVNKLNFSNLETKKIILLNPYIYSESPIELNKIIDYLKLNNYTIEDIKKLIIKNPKLIDLTYDEFNKSVEF